MNLGKMSKIYDSILLDLKQVEGVKMLALAGRDGFLIGEQTNNDIELFTLMSATMLRAAEKLTNRLEKVSPDRVVVDYEGGKLITVAAGQKALICLLTTKDASIEPINNELERTASRIKEIL
jgi:predicted regulator of Ras-like GTPase activity (Roadblock/LC7/MglB family)